MRSSPNPALRSTTVVTAAGLLWSSVAGAEVSARALLDALASPRDLRTGTPLGDARTAAVARDGRLPVLVRAPNASALVAAGLHEVSPGWAAAELTPAEVRSLDAWSDFSVTWSPALAPRLDVAGGWISVEPARSSGATTGRGVVIGIIDTAIDPGHADLRSPNGALRTAFYVDFSAGSGAEPALEAEYCDATSGCAIYTSPDLERRLADAQSSARPLDPTGHGTHVASLAAGNGGTSADGRYVGVAPEATLIAVRVQRADGSIAETDVLRAVRFVFEQAEALSMPAVVNLSLGNDFGAHDGTSPLELALAALVGPEHPGRALVVSAGNGGTTYDYPGSAYPGPFGIHTEARVLEGADAVVPLLTPSLLPTVSGSLFVWIGFRPQDDLAVGLDGRDGVWIDPVPRGRSETWVDEGLELTIVNEPAVREDAEVGAAAAALIVHGAWSADTVFGIRLRGQGVARLWVQSAGAMLAGGSPGALFAGASARATVNLPATHPDLIAVGATVNRNHWWAIDGTDVVFAESVGAVAGFSAAGPTSTGHLKPDLVAPGAFVIGAMALAADPRDNGGGGLFADPSHCAVEHCHVVDELHGVASGTSMAAPIVAGAAALLLERDPTLEQREILALLQAGAESFTGSIGAARAGAGRLDVARSLAALSGDEALDREPDRAASRVLLADDFARPGGGERLGGLLQLRTATGDLADGARPPRLTLAVRNGQLVEPLTRRAPGSYAFVVQASPGTGGRTLAVEASLDGAPFTATTVPIAVDRHLASGLAAARGGCAVGSSGGRGGGLVALGVAGVTLTAIARRRRRGTRRSSARQRGVTWIA